MRIACDDNCFARFDAVVVDAADVADSDDDYYGD
jgi:hypothetical protein